MSLLHRSPAVHAPRRRFTCSMCAFYSYDAEYTFDHLMTAHVNRRVHTVNPNPGRRSTDGRGAWAQRRQAAADDGQGLSRPTRRLS